MRSRSGSAVAFAAALPIADQRPGGAASGSRLRFYGGDPLEVTIGVMEAPQEEVFGEMERCGKYAACALPTLSLRWS